MQNSVGIWEQNIQLILDKITRRQIYPEQCIRTELENVTLELVIHFIILYHMLKCGSFLPPSAKYL